MTLSSSPMISIHQWGTFKRAAEEKLDACIGEATRRYSDHGALKLTMDDFKCACRLIENAFYEGGYKDLSRQTLARAFYATEQSVLTAAYTSTQRQSPIRLKLLKEAFDNLRDILSQNECYMSNTENQHIRTQIDNLPINHSLSRR